MGVQIPPSSYYLIKQSNLWEQTEDNLLLLQR